MVDIFFTEDDFCGNEGDPNPQVPVMVAKSLPIATRIILEVVPLTVEQAKNTMPLCLPENIPEDSAFSPQYAGNTFTNLLQHAMWLWIHKFQI